MARNITTQTIDVYMTAHGEDRGDVAQVLGQTRVHVNRKFAGTQGADWSTDDLDSLGRHWGVSPVVLVTGDLRPLARTSLVGSVIREYAVPTLSEQVPA